MQKSLRFHQKDLQLCAEDQRKVLLVCSDTRLSNNPRNSTNIEYQVDSFLNSLQPLKNFLSFMTQHFPAIGNFLQSMFSLLYTAYSHPKKSYN